MKNLLKYGQFSSTSLANQPQYNFSKEYPQKKEGEGTGIPGNMGMDHVGIIVPNVQEAVDFFVDVFDAEFDWEVVREPTPNWGERGWDKTFGTLPETYMPHVVMLKVGDGVLTQYIELFEFVSPDQYKPTQSVPEGNWLKFSDIGNSYVGFTFKDINKVVDHLKNVVFPKYQGCRFIQDPPMEFPLRGELCTSFFFTTPWGQWIECSEWSESKNLKPEIVAQRQPQKNPNVGKNILELPTPAYVIDLDVVDQNLEVMKKRIGNLDWKIPVKAHKCPNLANYLLENGGMSGIEVLTLTEAEEFAKKGFQNIYLANVVRFEDLERLSLLAKKVKTVRVCVEDEEYIEKLDEAIQKWEITSPIEVLVEINIGHNRCGVLPHEAPDLVKLVKKIEETTGSLKFVGLTGYEGHTPVLEPEAKTKETNRCHSVLKEAKDLVEKEGFEVGVLSAGGSCNYIDAINAGVITEIQAGGGALCDLLYYHKAHLKNHGHNMGSYLVTEIISVSKDKSRAMGNAGFKATGWHPFGGLLEPRDRDDLKIVGLSAEHTKFLLEEGCNVKRGDRIVLNPGYSDAMGFLHRQIYAVRQDTVVDVWDTIADVTWK